MPAIIVNPELIARLTRDYTLRGQLRPFNLTEDVVPVIDIGPLLATPTPTEVVTPTLATMVAAGHSAALRHYGAAPPDETDLNVSSLDLAPVSGTVMADTGQLAAGQHFVQASITNDDAAASRVGFVHRNAADNADLSLHQFFIGLNGFYHIAFTATVAVDERFVWRVLANSTGDLLSNVSAAPSSLDIAV